MKKTPIVNIEQCNMCMSCVEVCPEVFKENNLGYIHVVELHSYPIKKIKAAIMYCPQNCINWEEP